VDGNSERHYAPLVPEEVSKVSHRRTLLVASIGLLAGFIGFTVLGPEMVSWLYKPPVDSLSCAPTVDLALSKFVRLQLESAVFGGVVALIALFFWRRFFRRRAEAKQGAAR
jgi:hypothetical protein